jgi:hypothetical protein
VGVKVMGFVKVFCAGCRYSRTLLGRGLQVQAAPDGVASQRNSDVL